MTKPKHGKSIRTVLLSGGVWSINSNLEAEIMEMILFISRFHFWMDGSGLSELSFIILPGKSNIKVVS